MASREGLNRPRLRQMAPINDQELTPLGRAPTATPAPTTPTTLNAQSATSLPKTVVQNSGNIRQRSNLGNSTAGNNNDNNNNAEMNAHSAVDIVIDPPAPVTTFDVEQFCSEIKTHGRDEKRLEQLILNAIGYFLTTSKRSSQQQPADYTVLTFLAWSVTLHGEIFRLSSVLRAMCDLLKGSLLTKTMKSFSAVNNGSSSTAMATPYTLICQILWLAFKDQAHWPDEFIEAYVEDALGEQNWIKNPDCQSFVSNIQTAFHTRPCTWEFDRSKIFPVAPLSSATPTSNTNVPITSALNDDTSNDSNMNNESLPLTATESEPSLQTADESMMTNNNGTDTQLTVPRYDGRLQSIQLLLQKLLTTNAKLKSTAGTAATLNAANTSTSSSTSASQPHETDKLLYLLERVCGLPELRLYILSRLDIWLQNPKLNRTAERLMMSLCENLTKPTSGVNGTLTNGHANSNDLSYIDERAIEQLLNLRFKVRASGVTSKMYIMCVREMLKRDANLVEIVVRLCVHNELQQASSTTSTVVASKNPNNLPLLLACCQSQSEYTCQSLASTIQNILLLTNVTTTSKDFDTLLKLIRPFIREVMRHAKNDFDSMRFCMHLIDMHYSASLQPHFWTMVQQQDPPRNEISSQRLLKRLLECDMSTRERFLHAICDLIPMIILATAHAFTSQSSAANPNATGARASLPLNNDQWLVFIQRIAFIQCSACLFFLYTLPRLFDSTSTINPINYVTCLYSILFTNQVNSYLRLENWPPEEPLGFRNELFRLSSEIPLLGETLYLLIQIGLTPQFRINPSIIIDLIELIVRRTLNVEQKMGNDYASIYLHLPDNQCEIFLRKFFELTRYHIPIQIQFPPTYQIPKNLSITDIFWKACLICLLLASHDPFTFGRFVWLSVPQIRLFMEMLLTGDYTYPPKSMIETKDFLDNFYHKERAQLREEKDLFLELEKYLAAPKVIDETNSQLLGKITVLDLQQIKRPTSHDKNEKNFYNLIQGFNNMYKLSSMLCRCRSPDFILDVLNRKEQQSKSLSDSQTSWLTSLIDSNVDCLNVFPIICLCDYFQHMIMIYKNKNIRNLPSKKTLNALDTILVRFKSIIQSVKQQLHTSAQKSTQIDEMTCIFNYFLNCLNSNISAMRSNAWLCLNIILSDQSETPSIESLLSTSDPIPEPNIKLILGIISQFKSLTQTQRLIKQTLSETCHFETNIHFLHYSIIFIVDHCQIDSSDDVLLLSNLARALHRRHSVLYLLIQFDRQEKHYELIEKIFRLMGHMLIKKTQHALRHPIEIQADGPADEQRSAQTETCLVLPSLKDDQIKIFKQLQTHLNADNDFTWSANAKKLYVQINSTLIEFLLIFLAYYDSTAQVPQNLNNLAHLLQQFFLDFHCTPCFTTLKEMHRPVPVKQSQDEPSPVDERSDHFKQFAIEDTEQPENHRKRRLSHGTASEKVFLSSAAQSVYRIVPINNDDEQSLFLSDDLQYFIFKSNNFALVKQCIDQASFGTCLKMFKIALISHENINYLCQRVNQLLDSSSKQVQTQIKQSSFVLPLVNRWIVERVPEAIKLAEKLKKLLERKKKAHSTTQEPEQHSELIPTTSRVSSSISEQIRSFDIRISKLCSKTLANDSTLEDQMDTSESTVAVPWTDARECDELLKTLVKKDFDPIKRRQLLVELQWLTNSSEPHRSQLFEAVLRCCQSKSRDEFLVQLHEQHDSALVLLSILTKAKLSHDEQLKLINALDRANAQRGSVVHMKITELKRAMEQSEFLKTPVKVNRLAPSTAQAPTSLAVHGMLDMLGNHQSFSDCGTERQFYKYLKSNSEHEEECKRLLVSVLVQAESQLSEPTVGMILDQLEKMDYKSARSSTSSIYANRLLFSQRTHSSASQRLLLKQFLHACDWSTILDCITDLLTLPSVSSVVVPFAAESTRLHQRLQATHRLKQSRSSILANRDSTLILDLLEAFIKLSPLWSGREFKMLERCHDELLIDLNEQHIYTLVLYILDEGDRHLLANENLYERYQKRYESILYHLIKSSDTKSCLHRCLQKILIESESNLWLKDILPSFYFILYINQSDLFPENFYLILPDLFSQVKQHYKQLNFISTNYDYVIHDLLTRLNSYDLVSTENVYEINLLLKYYVSKHPFLFLRHLNTIRLDLQSRSSTLTADEFSRRNSKQRTFFLSLFDLIDRLKPYIYDQIYEHDLQAIIDVFIRLAMAHASPLNTCTKPHIHASNYIQDVLYLIDGLLELIYDYLYSTVSNQQHYALFRTYNTKFVEKIQEKVQNNKDLHHTLLANKQNRTVYHLAQLKILYEAIRADETTDVTRANANELVPFDARLCLTDRSTYDTSGKQPSSVGSSLRTKSIDMQHYRMKLSLTVDEYTSSMIVDEISQTLTDLKAQIDYYLNVQHVESILESLTNYLVSGNKQLIDQTYDFVFKYMEKYPQHSPIFYSTYMKCLLSSHAVVFQAAMEHFSHFMIYFQSKATELFQTLLKQGLINKVDVTTSITQAIRLLNLHRYDPITFTNLTSAMPSTTPVLSASTMATTTAD